MKMRCRVKALNWDGREGEVLLLAATPKPWTATDEMRISLCFEFWAPITLNNLTEEQFDSFKRGAVYTLTLEEEQP